MTIVLADRLLPGVADWAEELTAIRRDLHQHPELGFDTERTVSKIVEHLKAWGVEDINTEFVKGCVVAVIEGEKPGATIAIRADMDALPMNDVTDNAWCSTIAGRGHCCGHDGHTTWLLGVGRYLSAHRDFAGKVVLVFQADEETSGGAIALIQAGLIEKYGIQEIYGGHTEPNCDKGVIGMKPGPLQASCDFVKIRLTGKGTHGGRPHQGVDPIPVGAQIVSALQTIVSRKVDPLEGAVLSICSFNAGSFDACNVIPNDLTLSGTIRTFNPEVRALVRANIEKMVPMIAEANGCTAQVEYIGMAAAVINSEEQTLAAIEATRNLLGHDQVQIIKAFMSSEDFSAYLEKVPGCIIRVGIRDENHNVGLHNGRFDFNDEVLPVAVSVIANMALTRLAYLASK